MHRPRGAATGILTAVVLAAMLSACAPTDATGGDPGPSAPSDPPPPSSAGPDAPSGSPSGAPDPETPTGPASIALPTDCRAILSAAVLAQLDDVPLNHPAFGESGVLSDGSLRCIWGDPGADTTGLVTVISHVDPRKAETDLHALVADGFVCGAPQGGTRCEKTWDDPRYPVKDGRTVFSRADVWIDTNWSNLAPSGYTASIVDHLWPAV